MFYFEHFTFYFLLDSEMDTFSWPFTSHTSILVHHWYQWANSVLSFTEKSMRFWSHKSHWRQIKFLFAKSPVISPIRFPRFSVFTAPIVQVGSNETDTSKMLQRHVFRSLACGKLPKWSQITKCCITDIFGLCFTLWFIHFSGYHLTPYAVSIFFVNLRFC